MHTIIHGDRGVVASRGCELDQAEVILERLVVVLWVARHLCDA